MIQINAGKLLAVMAECYVAGRDIDHRVPQVYPTENYQLWLANSEFMCSELERLELASSLASAKNVRDILMSATECTTPRYGRAFVIEPLIQVGRLKELLTELTNRIRDELSAKLVLCIPSSDARYYEPSEPLFGIEVANKFPSLTYEIEQGGKCHVLDLSTASAFHFIRCLEGGIGGLSRCLGIADPTKGSERSWMKVLEKVKKQIDIKWPTSGDRFSGDGRFFEEAYAALAAMQNPYRNATMHLDQKYTTDEARHVMNMVEGFMKKLASRMDENGFPLA